MPLSEDAIPDDEAEIEATDTDDTDDARDSSSEQVTLLPRGLPMQPDESIRITCARPTRLIVVAGAAESGKTTLIASLYERFLQGPFAGFDFAGSSSLRGFEQVTHTGRIASGLDLPTTERTLRGEGRKLLHLRLRKGKEPIADLLLSDLSGEEFDAARDHGEEARRLQIVKAAHRLVVLVDGSKLVDAALRQAAREESTTLLRTFVEEGLVPAATGVDIVFTKWDLITPENRARHESFADIVWNDFRDRFARTLPDLRRFNVVARHPRGGTPPAFGLDKALPAWTEAREPRYNVPSAANHAASVEFDRTLARTPKVPNRLG